MLATDASPAEMKPGRLEIRVKVSSDGSLSDPEVIGAVGTGEVHLAAIRAALRLAAERIPAYGPALQPILGASYYERFRFTLKPRI